MKVPSLYGITAPIVATLLFGGVIFASGGSAPTRGEAGHAHRSHAHRSQIHRARAARPAPPGAASTDCCAAPLAAAGSSGGPPLQKMCPQLVGGSACECEVCDC